jgi:signal recognition particle subunit SRP19
MTSSHAASSCGGGSTTSPFSRFQIVYPAYINSQLTKEQGRRLSKAHCVDNPTAAEIYQSALHLGFQTNLEMNKAYSRDTFTCRGRVRIQIKDCTKRHIPMSEFDKTQHPPVNPDLPTKDSVLKKIVSIIVLIRAKTSGHSYKSGEVVSKQQPQDSKTGSSKHGAATTKDKKGKRRK